MKKFLVIAVLVVLSTSLSAAVFAQVEIQSQPFGGKLKLEAYGEYINFTGDDIDASAWGGGILARYLIVDWLGAQTNFTLYGGCQPDKLTGDMSFSNWRFSIIFHTYVIGMEGPMPLYIYGGGGAGYQFNSEVGDVKIDDDVTGHALAGIGYDFPEKFHLEIEGGYQFGNADAENYTESKINLDAFFIRAGVGFRI